MRDPEGITVIYRAYPLISNTPIAEFRDKNEMIGFCLESLVRALNGIPFDFIFVSDKCTAEQSETVQRIVRPHARDFERVEVGGGGNQASFRRQLDQVPHARFPIVLLLEDDYYIDAEDIRLNLAAHLLPGIEYSTFYFPHDAASDTGGMAFREEPVKQFRGLYVSTLPSTTLTFMAKRDVLLEDLEALSTFSDGSHDSSTWLRLTGKFWWFLTRVTKPMFRRNLWLFGSIIKRYLRYMLVHSVKHRKLVFVGYGRSTHLDSNGVFNTFSIPHYIQGLLEEYRAKGARASVAQGLRSE